jgi:hypothetical protein
MVFFSSSAQGWNRSRIAFQRDDPAMVLAAAVTIASGLASGRASGTILLALIGTLVSLQTGYFVGCVLQAHLSKKTAPDDIDDKN